MTKRIDSDEPYHKTSKLIMTALCPFIWQSGGEVCKSVWEIECGVGENTIRVILSRLIRNGLIKRECRPKLSGGGYAINGKSHECFYMKID